MKIDWDALDKHFADSYEQDYGKYFVKSRDVPNPIYREMVDQGLV